MGKTEKNPRHLSREQAKQVYAGLHELNAEARDLETIVSESDKLDELITPWAEWFEQSYITHLVHLLFAMGLGEPLTKAARSTDPLQAFLDLFQNDLADEVPVEEFDIERKRLVTSLGNPPLFSGCQK